MRKASYTEHQIYEMINKLSDMISGLSVAQVRVARVMLGECHNEIIKALTGIAGSPYGRDSVPKLHTEITKEETPFVTVQVTKLLCLDIVEDLRFLPMFGKTDELKLMGDCVSLLLEQFE